MAQASPGEGLLDLASPAESRLVGLEQAARELGVGQQPSQSPTKKEGDAYVGFEATLGGLALEPRRLSQGSETRLLEELKITVPQSSSAEDPKAARLAELDVAEQGEEEREIWAKS